MRERSKGLLSRARGERRLLCERKEQAGRSLSREKKERKEQGEVIVRERKRETRGGYSGEREWRKGGGVIPSREKHRGEQPLAWGLLERGITFERGPKRVYLRERIKEGCTRARIKEWLLQREEQRGVT